jgi:hypothetical protein
VLTDLFTVISHMRSSYETNRWLLDMRLPDKSWVTEQSHLSSSLCDQEWRDVATAFMNIAVWNDMVKTWRAADPIMRLKPSVKLGSEEAGGLSAMRASLISACGQAAESIRPLALPTIGHDDPLAQLFRDARDTGESEPRAG